MDQAKHKQAPPVCTATAPRDEPEVTGKEQLQQAKTILNEEERTTWCSMWKKVNVLMVAQDNLQIYIYQMAA